MQSKALERITEYSAGRRRRRRWRSVLTVMASVVVFVTTYVLILPAITMDNDPTCNIAEHTHTDECFGYAYVLSCIEQTQVENNNIYIHTHSDKCYADGKLVCTMRELSEHIHTDDCYALDDDLQNYVAVCGKEQITEHTHTNECYDDTGIICGKVQAVKHMHTDDCFVLSDAEKVITCKLQEHTHHEIACYADRSADVETSDDWQKSLKDVEFCGEWHRDVLAVAKSQIGYSESSRNVICDENGRLQGYTRYGEWYGEPYGEWSAMFVSFCLHYAGVEKMPYGSDCNDWMLALSDERYDLYRKAGDHIPSAGEIVFLDKDKDSCTDSVGIIAEIIPQIESQAAKLKVIQGDASSKVQYVIYEYTSESVIGYSVLPDGNYKEQTVTAQIYTDGTYRNPLESDTTVITVSGILPKNASVYAYPMNTQNDDEICAYDITVFDSDGNVFNVLDGESLDVRILSDKLKNSAFDDGTHPEVYYVAENGTEERMPTEYTEDGIEFKTDHFSLYAVRAVQEASAASYNDLVNRINNNAKYIRLTNSFTVGSAINIDWGKDVIVDLNGKTISSGSSNTVFNVNNGGQLTVLDSTQPQASVQKQTLSKMTYGNTASLSVSGERATLTYYVTRSEVTNVQTGSTVETLYKYTVSTSGAIKGSSQPIITVNGGTFNLQSGMLRSGTNRAVYQSYSGGTINLSGGYICGFERSYNTGWLNQDDFGGAVYSASGTLNISNDAVIAANKAGCGGGVAVMGQNKLNISGGVISGNVALFNNASVDHAGGGGLVACAQTTVTMSDGYITNNTANGQCYLDGGGGIFIRDDCKFTIRGGYVTGNKAQGGGGIKTSSGNGCTFTMDGGFFSGNLATAGEGAGICIEYNGRGYINAGYVTNNILENTEHWGGGGVFCADQAVLEIKNMLATDNSAGGFGGGVAGCPTGKIYLYVDKGAAIFDNHDVVDEDGIHFVSGGTKDGVDYKICNEMFQRCGHADYFCALMGTVSGTMLGGGSAGWRGSADYTEVHADKDDVIVSSGIMGLEANPDDEAKQNAYALATVYINGNYSYTHGGAIMCNGILVVGNPLDITLPTKVKINASKVLYEGGGTNELSLKDNDFEFQLIEAYLNGTVLDNAKCAEDGSIKFDHQIILEENGTYVYYVREIPKTNDNTILYDNTIYRITMEVQLDDGEIYFRESKKYTYSIVSMTVDKSNDEGVNWSQYYKTSSPQGGNVTVTLSEEYSFVNRTMKFTTLTVRKEWQGTVGADSVTVTLRQNGADYKTVKLDASNNWSYTWTDLPEGYQYTVHERSIPGYTASYNVLPGKVSTVQRQLGTGTWWVPASSLSKDNQYIIVSPDGKKALCTTRDHMDLPFTSEDTVNVDMQNGKFTLNGVQYSMWIPYDANMDNGAIYTPQDRKNNGGLALKSGVGDSWLLAQPSEGKPLKGTTGIDWSSRVEYINGFLMINNEFDNQITTLRSIVFEGDKFTSSTAQAPVNAARFLVLVRGNPTLTETVVHDAVVVITNEGSPVYALPETGGNGSFAYISAGLTLIMIGAYLSYRKIKSSKEDTASF